MEERPSKWTAFEGQIGDLVDKFQKLVRLARVVCGSSEITLNQVRWNAVGSGDT